MPTTAAARRTATTAAELVLLSSTRRWRGCVGTIVGGIGSGNRSSSSRVCRAPAGDSTNAGRLGLGLKTIPARRGYRSPSSPLSSKGGNQIDRLAVPPKEPTMAAGRTASSLLLSTVISAHYGRHEEDNTYEEAYFNEPGAYMEHLAGLVRTRLGLVGGSDSNGSRSGDAGEIASPPAATSTRHRILDVGGGTGNFARMLLGETTEEGGEGWGADEIIVIDPFLGPTASLSTENGDGGGGSVRFVKASAEAFLSERKGGGGDEWWREGVSQILMKEVVHHLDPRDRVAIFPGMHRDLLRASSTADDGRRRRLPCSLLIVTRPLVDIDYPLWDAARSVWRANQPSADTLMRDLVEAGFVNVRSAVEPYPCAIPLTKWQSMVQRRFWSTFSSFDDDELRTAAEETIPVEWRDRINGDGVLRFEDRLVFIAASVGA